MQSDPIGFVSGAFSLYGYVDVNPYNWTDPTGNNKSAAVLSGGGAVMAGNSVMAVSTGLAALVLSIQNAQFQSMDLWDVVPGDATRNRDPDDDDRCAEARVKLDRAKEITNQLGRCYADMGLAERFLRHTAWRRELFARSERDIACHGAPDGGHGIAQKNALNQMRRCATGGL